MITSTLPQLHWYKTISPHFAKAIQFFLDTDWQNQETGLHEIDGENAFAMLNEYTTKAPADCEWESHRKYADIQIMINGKEHFGYTPLVDQQPVAAYHSDNDVLFYSIEPWESASIPLSPGQFIIFFPSDIHQPEGYTEQPATVKKLVIKVKV